MTGGTPGGTERECPVCNGLGHDAPIITQQKVRPEVTLAGVPLEFPDQEVGRIATPPCWGCNGNRTVSAEKHRELLAEIAKLKDRGR
jgi:hypothetical protein